MEETKPEIKDLADLVCIICDYYTFKNQPPVESDDDEPKDSWEDNEDDDIIEEIIPDDIDELIKKSFTTQLKRFHK